MMVTSSLRRTMVTALSGAIVVTAVFCDIAASLLCHLGRQWYYIETTKIPGVRLWPIFSRIARSRKQNSDNILDRCMRILGWHSSPLKVWFAHHLIIFVFEPEQLKIVFNSPYTIEKADLYKFVQPSLGKGLLTAPEDKWRIHRKLITPAFHPSILKSCVEVFARQSEVMTKNMRKELEAGEFDIHRYVALCVHDIVCETIMGVKTRAQEGEHSGYENAIAGISETVTARLFRIWLHPEFIFKWSRTGREQRAHLKYFHDVNNRIIQIKKSSCNNECRVDSESTHEQPPKRNAFLALLLESSTVDMKLTDQEIRDEVNTMMAGGSHSTAMLSVFASVMLATNPEIQERAYRELCEIYGDQVSSGTAINHKDLNRMQYLERVIKETTRLFPIAPIIMRKVSEDYNIGEYTLPKGATICIPLMQIHRSKKYWRDPLKFDPDRFLPEEVAKRHTYCYVAFGGGPRNCIGRKWGMMAMKVILATLLRRYVLKKDKILSVSDIKLKADFLKPTEPITLRISERVNENVEK